MFAKVCKMLQRVLGLLLCFSVATRGAILQHDVLLPMVLYPSTPQDFFGGVFEARVEHFHGPGTRNAISGTERAPDHARRFAKLTMRSGKEISLRPPKTPIVTKIKMMAGEVGEMIGYALSVKYPGQRAAYGRDVEVNKSC